MMFKTCVGSNTITVCLTDCIVLYEASVDAKSKTNNIRFCTYLGAGGAGIGSG